MNPLIASIPHSGERIAPEAHWLKDQAPEALLRDVDRFVDKLYEPVLQNLKIPYAVTSWSRYNIDCNRRPDDLDVKAVKIPQAQRTSNYSFGLYWLTTTYEESLITEPLDEKTHKAIFERCYEPFHKELSHLIETVKKEHKEVYHLDLHSMPSQATRVHGEQGQIRPEITVSDNSGNSASEFFRDLVIKSYKDMGFEVVLNWPYEGGGITTLYGAPQKNQHTLQIELNRKLYMNETTKQPLDKEFKKVQKQLEGAVMKIYRGLSL